MKNNLLRFSRIIALIICLSFLVACGDNKETVDNEKTGTEESSTEKSTTEEPTTEEPTTEEPTTEEPTTEPPYVEPEIDVVMVGDILLHDNVMESGKLDDGTYNYDHLFANVKEDIQAADVAIANQEVILGGTEIGLYGYPNFNGPYEVGDALHNAGFNVVLHATNHTLDRGKEALVNCMNFWKKYPDVAVLGIFETQEAYDNNIYVYEQDGVKIAILNYTYGTNGMPAPADMPFAVAILEEQKVIKDLQKANEIADFVIVCPHWGIEYMHTAADNQKYWANIFMANGVDVVIGAHPHYIQPVEMLTDANGNSMLVYYSLGNFINSTADSGYGTADRMIGGMAKLTISKKENGEVYLKDYGVEPLVTQLSYEKQKITTYKLKDYNETLADSNMIVHKDARFNMQFCEDLSKEVFGELYKSEN